MKNELLSEFQLNGLFRLQNKILMAPMTRAKAELGFIPTEDMARYYARRAQAGLIVTEGTLISSTAGNHPQVPGIFNEEQIRAWKKVTDAVHHNGGLIFNQIWHVGRVSHPQFNNGALPVSASETMMTGPIPRMPGLTYGKSRAATREEIRELIEAYAQAARNAIEAGFDGVEIHGANGYLIDQFLHYHTNQRQDEFGGDAKGMAAFPLAVIKACGEAIGYERVGIRLSPGAYLNEIVGDERDAGVFQYLLEELNELPIAYVHTGNFNDSVLYKELGGKSMTGFIRGHYRGIVIACGSYTPEMAREGIGQGKFDLVAMGRPFIANPDFIGKLEMEEPVQGYEASMLGSLV